MDFNPRTPCGVRRFQRKHAARDVAISIHAPRVGCDWARRRSMSALMNFNPRTPCGVRRKGDSKRDSPGIISIHAPRVGCDLRRTLIVHLGGISIHAPRVGCDNGSCTVNFCVMLFQSTHPVWGATRFPRALGATKNQFQSTHPVWGATILGRLLGLAHIFQSTHPVWGATRQLYHQFPCCVISIHAPRVGCDTDIAVSYDLTEQFQSTHPVWGAT